MDWTLAFGALVVGVVVGLTGMGGGALMTPMLVLLFHVNPLTAVSSDLVASAVMKPVGSIVHIRQKTVQWDLVRWLALGSVPAAFCGVLIARSLGSGDSVETIIQRALGVALIIAATGLFVRAYLRLAERAAHRDGTRIADPAGPPRIVVRPVPTVVVGIVGGVVGRHDVRRLRLFDDHRADDAVPEAAGQPAGRHRPRAGRAAGRLGRHRPHHLRRLQARRHRRAAGRLDPGAFIGAQLSTRLPGAIIRRALAFVLLASALKLLGVTTTLTGVLLLTLAALAGPIWLLLRRQQGFPAWPHHERLDSADEPERAAARAD